MKESRVAFVTGGAGGIGGAICRSLAGSGCRVAVADLAYDAAQKLAAELRGLGVELDVTRPESVLNAVKRTETELGPVDVLVNCAGWDQFKPFTETDEDFLHKVLEINLAGPMRITRAVLPGMIARQWGRVINIASDAGRVGSSLEAVYSGAKGGLIAFTKTIARETARHRVTANAVCPGPTETPMLLSGVGQDEAARKVIDAMVRAVPMRRLGKPEDIGPAVAFLASDHAAFITGQTLSISGGLTMA
jgi:2-hydroxycyclohexanecarboxyl-CoA dehydrogenase